MPISSFSNVCFSVKHFGGFCLSFVYLRFGCLSVKKSSFFGLIDNCLSYKYPSASQSLHILCNTYRKVKARFLMEPVFYSSIKRPLTAGANRELRSIFVTLCKVDKCGGKRYGRTSLQKNRQKLGARHRAARLAPPGMQTCYGIQGRFEGSRERSAKYRCSKIYYVVVKKSKFSVQHMYKVSVRCSYFVMLYACIDINELLGRSLKFLLGLYLQIKCLEFGKWFCLEPWALLWGNMRNYVGLGGFGTFENCRLKHPFCKKTKVS